MDNILKRLDPSKIVLDLGCGVGSFQYDSYRCRIVAIDLRFDSAHVHNTNRVWYVAAESGKIPLARGTVDVVVCHHTLEHFSDLGATLEEIARVLNSNGVLWVAVPNGYGFDDHLYRYIFEGGGHINRFTDTGLVRQVETLTALLLRQQIDLFSGFVYLQKPQRERLVYFPRRAKILGYLPKSINAAAVFALNAITRLLDKVLKTRISQYGWAFVFSRQPLELPQQPPMFNVCGTCGSGHTAGALRLEGCLRRLAGFLLYSCPRCGATNPFIAPPDGLA
jgi:SAM-dependent methyltransferase